MIFVRFADIPKKAQGLLIALEIAFLEVEIEQERIKDALKQLSLPNGFIRLTDRDKVEKILEEKLVAETLIADIHLWLVTWGNINKLLRSLRKIMNDQKLDWIQNRRRRWFLTVNNIRNSFEHIDDRILKSTSFVPPVEDISIEIHRKQWVRVFGTKVNLDDSSFSKINSLKKDLVRWHSKLPTIFDTMESRAVEKGWKVSRPT